MDGSHTNGMSATGAERAELKDKSLCMCINTCIYINIIDYLFVTESESNASGLVFCGGCHCE